MLYPATERTLLEIKEILEEGIKDVTGESDGKNPA